MSDLYFDGSSTPTESFEGWQERTKYQLKPAGWAFVFILVSLLVTGLFYVRRPEPEFTKKETVNFAIKGIPFTLSRETK